MSFKSPEHSTLSRRPVELVSAVFSMQEGSLYRENFISIKQLHGNSSRAQASPAAKLPSCLSLFLGRSEWRGYPESATCQREERETVNISQSIDWLSDNKTNPISTWSRPSLSLSHFGLKSGSKEQQVSWKVPTIIRLSLIRWSYNRFTSILINGQKKDKSNL